MPIDAAAFQRAADILSRWRRPLLLTHARADGDAIGCVTSMRTVLRRGGAEPIALLFEPPADKYAWLCADDPLDVWNSTIGVNDLARGDGVLVMDTCTYSQLTPLESWLRGCKLPKIALDHHRTRDPLAETMLIDEPAAAACLIVFDWCRAAGWPVDAGLALTLFVGIATDTGWFRFSNTDPRALHAAAELVGCGLSVDELHQRLFASESAARVRLFAAAVSELELRCGGKLAVLTVTRDLLARCGAKRSDTEDLINEPMKIASVIGVVLLTEDEGGVTRVSFRSKRDVDVAALAAEFGGGGHTRAAGARLQQPLAAARTAVVARFAMHAGWPEADAPARVHDASRALQ